MLPLRSRLLNGSTLRAMRPSRSVSADLRAALPGNAHRKPADHATLAHVFRNTGKPRLAQEDTAKITDY